MLLVVISYVSVMAANIKTAQVYYMATEVSNWACVCDRGSKYIDTPS